MCQITQPSPFFDVEISRIFIEEESSFALQDSYIGSKGAGDAVHEPITKAIYLWLELIVVDTYKQVHLNQVDCCCAFEERTNIG